MKKKLVTTDEAMGLLRMSRGTFFARVKEQGVKPANFNPNLKKQHSPVWRREDIAKLGVIFEDEDESAHYAIA